VLCGCRQSSAAGGRVKSRPRPRNESPSESLKEFSRQREIGHRSFLRHATDHFLIDNLIGNRCVTGRTNVNHPSLPIRRPRWGRLRLLKSCLSTAKPCVGISTKGFLNGVTWLLHPAPDRHSESSLNRFCGCGTRIGPDAPRHCRLSPDIGTCPPRLAALLPGATSPCGALSDRV
jgi:hypothetical protein